MTDITLFRKRLIPQECFALRDDVIRYRDDQIIVTSWTSIRPKKDLHHGMSCLYLNEGWKISHFYTADNTLMYTYCDIVSFEEDSENNSLTTIDLLADVIIYPDGFVKVVDLDELAEAVTMGLITSDQLNTCLVNLNSLLTKIYNGELDILCSPLVKYMPTDSIFSSNS